MIVLRQKLAAPIRLDDIAAMEQQAEWCMRQYRVRHHSSLLSLDGARLTCLFDAPDAEALRQVFRQLGEDYEALWPASVHGPGDLPIHAPLPVEERALVVVERSFPEAVEFAAIQAKEERGAWCLEEHAVRFLRSYFATDRRRMLCLYAAPDAEAVRLAQARANMPVEQVWPARLYESRLPAP